MSTPPARRPGIPRRSVVGAAAEAARQAEQDSAATEPNEVDPATATADPAAVDAAPTARGQRQRLSNGRVSYAGRAVTIYFPSAEDKDRAQAAFAAMGGREGYASTSEWMADAILARVSDWERDHNGGEPFTDVLERRQARRRSR